MKNPVLLKIKNKNQVKVTPKTAAEGKIGLILRKIKKNQQKLRKIQKLQKPKSGNKTNKYKTSNTKIKIYFFCTILHLYIW